MAPSEKEKEINDAIQHAVEAGFGTEEDLRAALNSTVEFYGEEGYRREYQTCKGCGADLGFWYDILAECPLCGRKT